MAEAGGTTVDMSGVQTAIEKIQETLEKDSLFDKNGFIAKTAQQMFINYDFYNTKKGLDDICNLVIKRSKKLYEKLVKAGIIEEK